MKKYLCIVPLVLLFCFTIACKDKAAMAELEKFRAQAKIEEQNMALYRKTIEALNTRNLEFYRESMSPDYAYYSPSANPKPMSPDEVIAMIKTNLEGSSDARWRIEEQVASGDVVVSRVIAGGTNTAPFQGIPATGKRFEFSILNWCRLRDGKIVEEREEWDSLGFMQQLGMELKPKEVDK